MQFVPRTSGILGYMNISVKDLLDAGVHFGHQLRRYNPKSKKFVFDNRQGVSIIDLEKTYNQLEKACQFVEETVGAGRSILFVGTKRQAREVLREAAVACQMPFAVNRWLGGTLTNFSTVKGSLDKYKKYLSMESDGSLDKLPNKEAAAIRRDMARMNRNFEGLLELKDMPAAMFVVDTKTEQIAVAEAIRLKIPVLGLVDTNSDPTILQYPIPGNDDSIKSIRIIVEAIVDAAQAGMARREEKLSSMPTKTYSSSFNRADTTKEEQLPVTSRRRAVSEEDSEIPEVFSTDTDDQS